MSTGVEEAAVMDKEALECGRLGEGEWGLRERTVAFANAGEAALGGNEAERSKAQSIVDFRYLCMRMIKRNPRLGEQRVKSTQGVF